MSAVMEIKEAELRRRQYLLALILTMAGAVLFSAKGIFIKFAYRYQIDTLTLLTLRMAISVPIYLAIGLYSERFYTNRISNRQLIAIAVIGLLGYYVASFLDLEGLQYISVSLERVLLYLYPTFVLVLSFIVLKQRVACREIAALLISYGGIMLIFYDGNMYSSKHLMTGALFVIASAFVFAVFLLGSDRQIKKVGSVRFTAYAMSSAGFAVFLHYLLQGVTSGAENILELDQAVYGWAAVLALFSTLLPTFFIAHGVKILGARKVSIIGVVGPVSTILLGVMFMGDHILTGQLLGMAIVITAVSFIVIFNKADKD